MWTKYTWARVRTTELDDVTWHTRKRVRGCRSDGTHESLAKKRRKRRKRKRSTWSCGTEREEGGQHLARIRRVATLRENKWRVYHFVTVQSKFMLCSQRAAVSDTYSFRYSFEHREAYLRHITFR